MKIIALIALTGSFLFVYLIISSYVQTRMIELTEDTNYKLEAYKRSLDDGSPSLKKIQGSWLTSKEADKFIKRSYDV